MHRGLSEFLAAFVTLLSLTTVGYGALVADAGTDQRVYHPNEPVILDGSGSVFADPSGPRQLQWTQIAGAEVQLNDPAAWNTAFVPPAEGAYEFALVVADGQQTSEPDVVEVVVGSAPTRMSACTWPVAEGGNGHAYQPVNVGQLIPWTQADAAATGAGGYLATITSAQESDFLYDVMGVDAANLFVPMMGNYYGPWLGGYQQLGSAEPAEGWAWVTGEPFEYTAWNSGEPSNTAGGLNEDRLHYLGHGGAQPLWNDQIDSDWFGPTSFVIEYDPVACEAEEATTISGGVVANTWGGYSGTGYITLDGQANCGLQWVTHMGMAGARRVRLRYAQTSGQDVPIEIAVNGVPAKIDLPDTSVGTWPAWSSVTVDAYFRSGSNVVEVLRRADGFEVSVDKITVFTDDTNLVFNQRVIASLEVAAHPAAHALDGNPLTYWRVEGLPQWLEVDLGDIYDVHCIQVVGMYGQSCQFQVEAKTHAGGAYLRIVDRTDDTAGAGQPQAIADTFEPVSARYVRLTVTGGAGVAEFYVSAVAAPPAITLNSVGYPSIQAAIDAAYLGDIVTLQPGMYTGPGNQALDMKGKSITLASSDPNNPDVTAHTVIVGTADAPAVRCDSGEGTRCVLAGLTLTGAQTGVFVENASPTIRGCRIVGNTGPGLDLHRTSKPHVQNCLIAGNGGAGVAMHVHVGRARLYNTPRIANCTIVENLGGGIEAGKPDLVDSIVYYNRLQGNGLQIDSEEPVVTYCDVEGGFPGEGNFDADPAFVRLGIWVDADNPDAVTGSGETGAVWISGDYHLRSETGRWDPENGGWRVDAQTSPCIDAGSPATPPGDEPDPHGDRVNLGAYGGTRQASMTRDAAQR